MTEKKMADFTNFVYEVVDENLKSLDYADKDSLRDYLVDDILDYVINGTSKRADKFIAENK